MLLIISGNDTVLKLLWDGKDGRVEVTDGIIVDLLSLADAYTNLSPELYDLRSYQCFCKQT